MKADMLMNQAVEESFSLRNDNDTINFKTNLEEKLKSIEQFIRKFDEDVATGYDFK